MEWCKWDSAARAPEHSDAPSHTHIHTLQLAAAAAAVMEAAETPGAAPLFLVLPVFEVAQAEATAAAASSAAAAAQPGGGSSGGGLPRTKAVLARHPGGARPFHCGAFPQATPSLDYNAWWKAGRSDSAAGEGSSGGSSAEPSQQERLLDVEWHDFFEPVGLAATRQLPRWNEAFRGYGLNKVQLGTHLASLGFRFRVSGRLSVFRPCSCAPCQSQHALGVH
jgi:hypothetical protein